MKATRLIGFFLLCALLPGVIAHAQLSPRLQQLRNSTFDHISSEQGLPSDAVNTILEDSRGFMWFGTEGGLCRYDGYTLLTFKRNETDNTTIGGSVITCLFENPRDGTILVGMDTGLDEYSMATGKFTHFFPDTADPHSLSGIPVTICRDRAGTVWVGTLRGLNEMVIDSTGRRYFVRYLRNPADSASLSSNLVTTMCEDDEGTLWIGTGNGLNRFDRRSKKFRRFSFAPPSEPKQRFRGIVSMQKDRTGVLWLGMRIGLVRFDPRSLSFKLIRHDPEVPLSLGNNVLDQMAFDGAGNLWIATDTGLEVMETASGECLHFVDDPAKPHSLGSDEVGRMYVDRRGCLWMGTKSNGVRKVELAGPRYIRLRSEPGNPNSLSDDCIWEMVEDKQGNVWIGSSTGLNRYNPKTRTFGHYFHSQDDPATLSHRFVQSLCLDRGGLIWAGALEGLNRIDPVSGRVTRFYYEPEPPHVQLRNMIIAIHQDSTGRIWLGTADGAKLLNEQKKQFEDLPLFGQTHPIIADRDGRTLWVGTAYRGLVKIDIMTQTARFFSHNPHDSTSISMNWILAFCEDIHEPDRILWVTTWGGGLNRFDKVTETFTHFDEQDGLADNQIVSIVFDQRGFIWLGTMRGLSRFDPKTRIFRNYDARDGITSGEGNERALLTTSTGEIFVGTTRGITIFHPDSLRDNPHVPPIVLTDFRITNKSVVPGAPNSPLTKTITETKEIVLSYLDNMISFEFAALDYVMPSKNQYAYRLEGFDKDWIQSGNVRNATYTNLDPGKYIFRVKGSNNDGIWNEEGTSLSIIITPPWWKTTWAYLVYVIIIGTIFYSIYHVRMNRLQLSHQLQIEHLESEKMHEVDRMKSRFFANISHEFRTPLTLILGPIEKWMGRLTDRQLEQRHPERPPAPMHYTRRAGSRRVTNEPMTGFDFAQPDEGEAHRDLSMMQRNAHRLLRLINQLLDLSKLEAGAMKFRASRMNIVPLVKGIAYSFESSAGMRNVELNMVADQDEIEVYCDRDMVEKILTNLLSNAFKFTPEGGAVTVSMQRHAERSEESHAPPNTGRDDERSRSMSQAAHDTLRLRPAQKTSWTALRVTREGCVEISVSDTGIGIPPEQLDKVFDRFFQVDASQTREHEGSGIGLSLVKELVDLHHGTIQVQSEVGRGTEFTVRLPLGRSHLKDEEIVDVPVSPGPSPHEVYVADAYKPVEDEKGETDSEHAKGEKPIILIVEDNADVRAYIKDYLVPAYQVTEARDGAEGIEKAIEIIPDLIISDVMMPKEDGYEVCRALKLDEKTSHIPIILLTAKAASENKIEGLEIGADDYLIKPFEPKELLARIKNLIDLRRKLRARFSTSVPLKPGEIAVSSIDDVFLKKVAAVVERRMGDETFSVEELGQEVAMSRSQVHRKLIALTNQSASDFIRYMRLHRAMDLLKNNAGTVAEVAYSVGYSNPSHFSKRFHEQFGLAPGEARKNPDNTRKGA